METLINPNQLGNRPKVLNVAQKGNLILDNYSIRGFSSDNYIFVGENKGFIKDCSVINSSDTIQFIIKFKTGSDINTFQNIIGWLETIDLYIESASLKIWSESSETSVSCGSVSANTEYWCKVIIEGDNKTISYSSDGITYTGEQTIIDTTKTLAEKCILGMAGSTGSEAPNRYFRGSIDLYYSYIKINGEYWWKGVETL